MPISPHHQQVRVAGGHLSRQDIAGNIDRPAASTLSKMTSIPCRARFLASSSDECLVSMTFSLVTVTTRTLFAFSSIGMASATALAAKRPKSHATTTVFNSNGPKGWLSGNTSVGRPDPKMMASAYH